MRDAARFDRCQFDNRQAQPVGQALADEHGEMHSASRLSFDDYDKAHCFTHSFFSGRSKTPPCWATDLNKLGLLLARFFELRALIHCPRIDTPERRVVHAQSKILSSIPANVAVLDRMTAEYVALKNTGGDPGRVLILEKQIRALDGKLVIDQRGPSLVVGIVHYLKCGYSSVETSAALNHLVSPQAVRQIAHRLEQLWQRLLSGTDNKPKPVELRKAKRRSRRELSGYGETQAEREKARRAAETPEQRAIRL